MPEELINVINPDGRVVGFPKEAWQMAYAQGYKLASKNDLRDQDLEDEYGVGLENHAKAIAQGLVKSVPFVGGAALRAAGVTPEVAAAREKAFPLSTLSAEAAGTALQFMTATGPLGAINKLGKATKAAAIFGKEASIANVVAGSAVEGALYNLGTQLNEDILGQREVTASNVLSSLGTGALWGGAGGALFENLGKASKAMQEFAANNSLMDVLPAGSEKHAKKLVEKILDEVPVVGSARRLFRSKGAQILQQVGVLQSLDDMSRKAAIKMNKLAGDVFRSGAGPYVGVVAERSLDNKERFNEISHEIENLSNNPDILVDNLSNKTEVLSRHAPGIAGLMQETAIRGLNFLYSKLPSMPETAPLSAPLEPSAAEMAKFMKYYRAVEEPLGVFEDVAAGTITDAQVEALQFVHPDLYQSMQTVLIGKMTSQKSIPYKTKLSIGMFLGRPLINSMQPEIILQNQMSLSRPAQQTGQNTAAVKPTQSGLKNLSRASRSLTPMQKSARRME